MRRRMFIMIAAALILASVPLFARQPEETEALQAWLEKAKSDCASFQGAITLTYNHDDTGDEENRDFFRLELYDQANNLLGHIEESITSQQSPFYWQTGRIPAAPFNGKYQIKIWDTDDKDNEVRVIEHVWYDCTTDASWREKKPIEDSPDIPQLEDECYAWVPLYTTNLAPEDGAVLVMWSYFDERDADNPEYVEVHMHTIDVKPNTGLDEIWVRAPCGTYLKLYYQPDSNKALYYMPSQYWPHNSYGVPSVENEVGPVYYTFYPLDGPQRSEDVVLTPTPTSTPLPTLTPTPES